MREEGGEVVLTLSSILLHIVIIFIPPTPLLPPSFCNARVLSWSLIICAFDINAQMIFGEQIRGVVPCAVTNHVWGQFISDGNGFLHARKRWQMPLGLEPSLSGNPCQRSHHPAGSCLHSSRGSPPLARSCSVRPLKAFLNAH